MKDPLTNYSALRCQGPAVVAEGDDAIFTEDGDALRP